MLHELARVFSSQGVLVPGSEKVAVQDRKGAAPAVCDHKGPDCHCFGPKFEQASAKLELSRTGRALQAADAAASSGKEAGADAGAGTVTDAGTGTDAATAASAPAKDGGEDGSSRTGAAGRTGADGKPLGPEAEKQVRDLEKRDREVKAHEAAHQAAAGGQARGGAAFQYQTGPDGKRYAVGGHVDIDVSPVQGNPRATLAKAQTAQRAALAPADPSGQDRAVAAAAAQMAVQAQQEIAAGQAGGGSGGEDGAAGGRRPGAEDGARNGAGTGGPASARMRAYLARPTAGAALSVYA